MIDLHLHLDGSMTADEVIHLAERARIEIGDNSRESVRRRLSVPKSCKSLNDYLNAFTLPNLVLQTAYGISYAVTSLVLRLYKQGLRYAEIRFAPQKHCTGGMHQTEVVQAAVGGLNKGLKQAAYRINAQLILCCMRGRGNDAANEETLRVAAEYLSRGVCAMDLAGAEALFPTRNYEKLFQVASAYGIPFTIHAGEADGPESMEAAMRFGAQRIGHGVRCIEKPCLQEQLAEKGIVLEMCPTSNLQTHAIPHVQVYPMNRLMQQGIAVTVNTDNMTVSGTTLRRESCWLMEHTGMTQHQIETAYRTAAQAAFISDEEKQELIGKISSEAVADFLEASDVSAPDACACACAEEKNV